MTKVIRFLNIIYMAIAAAAITIYFTVPFVNVTADVVISKNEITTLLKNIEGAEKVSVNDIFKENEKVEASLGMNLAPAVVFKAYTAEADDIVEEEFINKNVDSVMESLKQPIYRVSEALLKMAAKETVKEELNKYGVDIGSLTDEDIDNAVDQILDAIKEDGATVDSIVDEVEKQVEDLIKTATGEDVDIDTEELKDKVEEELDKMGAISEDGTIENIEDLTSALLYDILTGMDKEKEEEEEEVAPAPYILRADEPAQDKTVKEKAAEVNDLLAQQIKDKLPSQFAVVSSSVFKGMLFTLIIFIGSWLFLFIFTLARTFRRKKCYTTLNAVFWVIGVLQIVSGIGLIILSKNAFKLITNITQITGSSGMGLTMFESMTFTLTSSAYIPGILVIALIPLSIVYHVFKKKLKRQIKIDKAVDKKLAEMKAN